MSVPMWDAIIKNGTASDIVIEDLGITIPGSGQITMDSQYRYNELAGSDDLRQLVEDTDLVVNDGTSDLSAADGVLYLTFQHQKAMKDDYYTKIELNTSGAGGQVDWDNIINKPGFGFDTWIEPVSYRVLDIAASAPGSPSAGDVYVDTDDDHFYKYNGSSWDDLGIASSGHRVINLANGDEDVYEYNGSSWDELAQELDNSAAAVDDDGDGKQSIYVYDTTAGVWSKAADVDFSGHLDGGPNKHDASEVDVEGDYTYITTAPTDLETVINELDTIIGTISPNTLDGAYDEGGAGVGRSITVDTGAVVMDASGGNYAPLQLNPVSSAPSTGAAAGQVCINDGIVYVYDATRGKWLSSNRMTVVFGRRGLTKDQELNFGAGSLPSNNSGYRMVRDATIVSMSAQIDASGTCDMHLRSNDNAADLVTQSISAALGAGSTTTDQDLSSGDFLQSYLESAAGVADPMLVIEIAWRLS